jgi:mono/diheme cytochrome c family protein
MNTIKNIVFITGLIILLTNCGKRDPQNQGTEFAPQMYLSKAYEPYTQVDGEKNKFNPQGLNMRMPAHGTVSRRRFNTTFETKDSTGVKQVKNIMAYNIHKDSIVVAEKTLKNPFEATPAVLEEGKALYLRYCSACHGEQGNGKGKVADLYKGVPNYSAAAYKNLNGGHIYHVITHGKGRMWPHGSQLNPDERWKVVHYVHTLQNPDGAKTEAKADSTMAKK